MDINEKYFNQATEEYNSDVIDDSIMSKSLSLSGGDEEKDKWKYIELRAERISGHAEINVTDDDERKVSKPIKSFFSQFTDDEDKKKRKKKKKRRNKFLENIIPYFIFPNHYPLLYDKKWSLHLLVD